ncbi:hypothetical protein ASPWEDRAFT_42511 [Aspergillus wentii DTO 134E9]|uniref:Aspergillopepsin-2 n=1 Tax=Aspergillus wentii DTO 134E9 TaxID=1073089 RepID=A0A1L9RHU1_ASPWE|nr:uncharacterized protein ASPWEDRAFT_42511 [Aspergillus wentii DTO 134E9]KAI9925836.1 hypothetical protein MW887_005642 [Aspergillus wentii]OJJ34509.1 hypothetical protein ASPWEDRAFT_42511 [Aspergillus wentii DTO 134E9]
MKLTTELLYSLCLAGSALAAPRSGLAERIQARTLDRQTHPLQPIAPNEEYRTLANIQYSNNWAGAVRTSPPPEGAYTEVSASFVVPEPKAIANSEGTQAASAWVGIDGDTYTAAILQTGVDFYIDNGKPVYHAWYEWFPEKAYDFDLVVNPGDVIFTSVQSFSPSEGIAIVENLSTGQKASQTISAPNGDATLAGQNADWIVEDFQSGGTLVNLVDFGTVSFSGAGATAGGARFGVKDAGIIELKQGDKVLTDVEILSDSDLDVSFTG